MTHGDDDGLVLPPKIAPAHAVLIPIIHKEEQREEILSFCRDLAKDLRKNRFCGETLRILVDERDLRGGEKSWGWIKKGVPIRIEIGPRDIAENRFGLLRRDKPHRESTIYSREELLARLASELEDMQEKLYQKALAFRDSRIHKIDSKEEFYAFFTPKNRENPEIHGGFALSHWSGEASVEEIVKKDLNVTIRCIPFDEPEEKGRCVISGKPSQKRVIFAKSY